MRSGGRWGLLVLVLGLVVVTGCTREVAGSATAGPDAAAASTAPPTAPSAAPSTARSGDVDLTAFAGTWEGTYTCAMGGAGLRLIIEEPVGDSVTAVFEFFPLPENPDVPSGSFTMTGRVESGTVVFIGGDWIVQPPDYVTVNLTVLNPPTGGAATFGGTVDDPGCALFEVSRV